MELAKYQPNVMTGEDIFLVLGLSVGLLLLWIFTTEYYRKKGEKERKAADRRKFDKDYNPGRRASDPKPPEEKQT